MRLLYLSADPGVPVFGGKGASVHLRAMASAFAALGTDVLVASPRVEPGENSLPEGLRCVSIAPVKPRECATEADVHAAAQRQADEVQALAARERIDAIYERYSLASFAGARTARALNVPLVVEVNAPLREEAQRFRVLAHEQFAILAERETFAQAQRIFAVSRELAERVGGEVMGNAPPDRGFDAKAPIAPGAAVVVGFSGGLKRWHGIDTLLAAHERALQAGAQITLEILGTGPALQLVEQAQHVRHLGHLPHEQALDVLARWDVGIAAFDAMEGFYFSPLKLFEYMAAGLCPVVSDVGELPAIIGHGEAGLIVSPGDARSLADALLELDSDRDRIRRLGARAQQLAAALPSWRDNATRVLQAIAEPVPAGAST